MSRGSTAVRTWMLGMVALACMGCQPQEEAAVVPAAPAIGGDFTLTDHDNKPFELASQRGKAVLIFFGYASCPDACPTTLSKISAVYRRLGDDAAKVQTLYITVDPDRDTKEILKEDLSYFRINAIGLTGTKAEIDKVVAQYGASYEIVPMPESAAQYTVAHSTTLYALDTNGKVQILFPYEATVEEITTGLQGILASGS